jgi:hypothetical protein
MIISPSSTLKSLETKTIFEKSTEKFPPPPLARSSYLAAAADAQTKSETCEPPPPKPESFALAAAGGRNKFEFFSRRRRLRRRLTPLILALYLFLRKHYTQNTLPAKSGFFSSFSSGNDLYCESSYR